MKRLAVILGVVVGVFVLCFLGLGLAMQLFFRVTEPDQPQFGFTGNWRLPDVVATEERPLPPAAQVWQDYSSWTSAIPHGRRLYLARLGGGDRQSGFHSTLTTGDTPMGAQRYTSVEFIYRDPTNGVYSLTWFMRGKHDASLLRFDTNSRLYQLQPHGSPDDKPPRLAIVAVEGIKPGGP
jgi:hypothetical protein